jgi:hypothetical protein
MRRSQDNDGNPKTLLPFLVKHVGAIGSTLLNTIIDNVHFRSDYDQMPQHCLRNCVGGLLHFPAIL